MTIFFRYILLSVFFVLGLLPNKVFSDNFRLSIEKIMSDPKWMGSFPSGVFWSEDSKNIFFMWNNENAENDSLYVYRIENGALRKMTRQETENLAPRGGSFNVKKTSMVFLKDGDLYVYDIKNKKTARLTATVGNESNPVFIGNGNRFTYLYEGNLFIADTEAFSLRQLTDFRKGSASADEELSSEQKWVREQENGLFKYLNEKAGKIRNSESNPKPIVPDKPKPIYTGQSDVSNVQLSPDCKFVTFRMEIPPQKDQRTIVPSYVNGTGYTNDIFARPKVGTYQTKYRVGIYNIAGDSLYYLNTSSIPGIDDFDPLYHYPEITGEEKKNKSEPNVERDVIIYGPYWSGDGKYPAVIVRTLDNKDRWIMLLDKITGNVRCLSHEHDNAWIGVPWWIELEEKVYWMPDNRRIWFLSEESGFAHIYTIDVESKEKKQITSGNFEVSDPFLSPDGKSWYFTSSEKDSGERHFYRLSDKDGKTEMLTSLCGNNQVTLSPDGKKLAILYSYANMPWELYISESKTGSKPLKITDSTSPEFKSYKWRDPEIIEFTASDGQIIRARLYRPEKGGGKCPGVIFVHGAGYVQNAHRWWSNYFREYMFNNFLADNGYAVLDIDYRGSAGYGHKFGTSIYRNMGGKDLDDQVDGAEYLIKNCDVDRARIGIYGGSYGGFITLMAMFTKPGVFAAGAALRPVTDWAHYEHPYTASILNIPQSDSAAYMKSSPIYHAEGLEGALLICHGMVDTNVQFQDVARLSQRLIELGKDNWEVALYPVENHGFTRPDSWKDEYRRIFKLFERELK